MTSELSWQRVDAICLFYLQPYFLAPETLLPKSFKKAIFSNRRLDSTPHKERVFHALLLLLVKDQYKSDAHANFLNMARYIS